MKDNLEIENNNIEDDPIMKEIKKMVYIKYLNGLLLILRFILIIVHYDLNESFTLNKDFSEIMCLSFIIYLPIITINLLIYVIKAICYKNFIKRLECIFWIICPLLSILFNWVLIYTTYFTSCIADIVLFLLSFLYYYFYMEKNLICCKGLILILFIIQINWKFVLSYIYIDLDDSKKRVLNIIIVFILDSLSLLFQFYCFDYTSYFFSRIKKYIEYHKILLIKNKKEEASFIRNTLPVKIEDYINLEEEELENI